MVAIELLLLKLIIAFLSLWLMTRLLGKKEIAQLTPFDFISSIVMSELVGNTFYDDQIHIGMLLFALLVWTGLSYLFEKITEHSKRLRKPLEGKPVIIIAGGEIDMEAMRKNSLDFDQLRMMLRQKDIFSVSQVAYAIYETNGSLSILPKTSAEDGQEEASGDIPALPRSLVENGIVQQEGLQAIGKSETWLRGELQASGYPDLRQVAYAEWTEEGRLEAIPKLLDHDSSQTKVYV